MCSTDASFGLLIVQDWWKISYRLPYLLPSLKGKWSDIIFSVSGELTWESNTSEIGYYRVLGRSYSLVRCCLISTFKTRSGANGKHSFLGLHLHSFSHWPRVLTWSLLESCWNPRMVGAPEFCAPRMSWMFYAMGMTKQSDTRITSISSALTRIRSSVGLHLQNTQIHR